MTMCSNEERRVSQVICVHCTYALAVDMCINGHVHEEV